MVKVKKQTNKQTKIWKGGGNSEDMGGMKHLGICEGEGVKFVHAAHGRVWIFSGNTHC